MSAVTERGVVETGVERAAITAAQPQMPSVLQDDIVFASGIERERLDATQVDDAGTVDPAEHRGIQFAVELRDRPAYQVRLRSHVEARVVVRCLDPIDVG